MPRGLVSPDYDGIAETAHVRRRQALAAEDPAHTVVLRQFLGQQMKRLQASTHPNAIVALVQVGGEGDGLLMYNGLYAILTGADLLTVYKCL